MPPRFVWFFGGAAGWEDGHGGCDCRQPHGDWQQDNKYTTPRPQGTWFLTVLGPGFLFVVVGRVWETVWVTVTSVDMLTACGYDTYGADGIFGNNTLSALKSFQRDTRPGCWWYLRSGKQGCFGTVTFIDPSKTLLLYMSLPDCCPEDIYYLIRLALLCYWAELFESNIWLAYS